MLDTLAAQVQAIPAGRRVPRVYSLEIAPLIMGDGTALYLEWIIEDEDGTLYRVPAEPGGWLRRSPYDGPSNRLRPVATHKAALIASLTHPDADDLAAGDYTYEHRHHAHL